MLFASAALLVAPLVAYAAPSASLGNEILSTLVCPSGYTAGSVNNQATFPVGVAKIDAVVKNFFDSAWEGFTVTSHSGTDDEPGAIRTFSFGGAIALTEELISNIDESPLLIDRLWKGVGGSSAGTLPVVATAFDATLASWTEHFTITPTCDGKATFFNWSAYFCSTNNAVATELYNEAHTGPFATLHAEFGNFTTCSAI